MRFKERALSLINERHYEGEDAVTRQRLENELAHDKEADFAGFRRSSA